MLHTCPHIFNRVTVGALGGRRPPVHRVLSQFCQCVLAAMLRDVVLLEPVFVWETFLMNGSKPDTKNKAYVLCRDHNTGKQHYGSNPPGWDATPHMYFCWVFCSCLEPSKLSNSSVALSAVGVNHHWWLIHPDYIVEALFIFQHLLAPLQSLCLLVFTYHPAIFWVWSTPNQAPFLSVSQYWATHQCTDISRPGGGRISYLLVRRRFVGTGL